MKIAQVAPLFESVPPKLYGGTERVVHFLTEELIHQGHEVTLFASGDSVTRARLVATCPTALRLNDSGSDPVLHHFLHLEQVYRLAPEFDIIHLHVDYLHYPTTRRLRLPQLSTLHGRLDLPDLVHLYREFQELPLVSISDDQRRPLAWANWLGTVHHGLPLDLLPCGPGGDYLAFLGRISPEKRLDRAIEIAIRSGRPLKIAAKVDKADKAYFESEIRHLLNHPLVEYLGEIGDREKGEFLGHARALLFPIDWPEPFGLVMIEAMACGTPIIAWPSGSAPEVIAEGVTGYLVDSIEEAVAAVSKVDFLSRGECRRYFEERFSATRMARDYLEIYRRVTDTVGRPRLVAN